MTTHHKTPQPLLHAAKAAACAALAIMLSQCTSGMSTTDRMMWSTHPIYTKQGSATAFIVECRDGSGRKVPVVVTSTHVLEAGGGNLLLIGVRIPNQLGGTSEGLLGLSYEGTGAYYTRHPSHDVAAFPLAIPEELRSQAHIESSLTGRSVRNARNGLGSGVEVGFLGYPEALPGTEGGFAVLRSGRVASYAVGAPAAPGTYIINADVYPGDSGAPVYRLGKSGRPQLAGMITKRIGTRNATSSNLAIAVNATVIDEVLELLAIREGWRTALPRNPDSGTATQESTTSSGTSLKKIAH
jgi:hypothetical protein